MRQKVGGHPRVSTLMTGIFNRWPPHPKYSSMWDVETVLDYFWKHPNNYLSDKLLTPKPVMFLTLRSAYRVSEITSLDLKYFSKHPSVYVFCLQAHKNLEKRDGTPPTLRFYSFSSAFAERWVPISLDGIQNSNLLKF